jgi:hypothetical protein
MRVPENRIGEDSLLNSLQLRCRIQSEQFGQTAVPETARVDYIKGIRKSKLFQASPGKERVGRVCQDRSAAKNQRSQTADLGQLPPFPRSVSGRDEDCFATKEGRILRFNADRGAYAADAWLSRPNSLDSFSDERQLFGVVVDF